MQHAISHEEEGIVLSRHIFCMHQGMAPELSLLKVTKGTSFHDM